LKYIPVAIITKPHGVRGALRIKPQTDFKAQRFFKGASLYLETKKTMLSLTVENHFEQTNVDVIKFKEFNDINAVEPFRNHTLYVSDDQRQTLEADAYYYDDLTNLSVYENQTFIGTVKRVETMPQGAVLRIERKGQKDALVPFMKVFVESVDLENARITIKEIEGLL